MTSNSKPSVVKETADAYCINNNGEWARIFIQSGCHANGTRWGMISVISGFGNFGHTFGNVGASSFERFLAGLNYHYLIGKFFGVEADVFDAEATAKKLRTEILRERRSGEMLPVEAREFWDGLDDLEGLHSSEAFITGLVNPAGRFLNDWELWDCAITKPNPQAEGFWSEIWQVFRSQLLQQIEDSTPEAA